MTSDRGGVDWRMFGQVSLRLVSHDGSMPGQVVDVMGISIKLTGLFSSALSLISGDHSAH
jgi:hypothetical protein